MPQTQMPITQNRWTIQPKANPDLIFRLCNEINISEPVANLLIHRGIDDYEKAKKFFRPSFDDLHDPFLMKDMDIAVHRIEKAIASNEKILVYGDYDVDGTTSVSLMYTFLKKQYSNLDYYIPDRYEEGYGISYQGIDFAEANNFSLIIALDCGIKAIDKIAYANQKNIDFIICDHHLPGEKIPQACAVLDPKRVDCNYPYKELSGCGVGFKLIQAFAQQNNISFEALHEYLDLVAISVGCDIVPITGENRVLAHFGLIEVNKTKRLGIQKILELTAKKDKDLTIMDLVFVIGPRINAAGRIESAKNAVKLLITDNPEEADDYGLKIHDLNAERRGLDKEITEEALEMIEGDDFLRNAKSTVLFKEDWHKGVIGIVASRVIETYYRPTIILTESKGKATGSARSVIGFNVHEAIEKCEDLLEQFGGHKYAAGLTMKLENIDAFRLKFNDVVSNSITEEQLTPEIIIDSELDFNQITKDGTPSNFYSLIQQFAPFGPENMRPVFVSNNVFDTGWAKVVGESHLKMTVFQENSPHIKIDCIGFGLGHFASKIGAGIPFQIVYNIEENTWNNKTKLQLNIRDIRLV